MRAKMTAAPGNDGPLNSCSTSEAFFTFSQVDAVSTAADGTFALTGVEGRRYIVVAHSENTVIGRHRHSATRELAPGELEPVELLLSEDVQEEDCEICKRFPIHLSPLWEETTKSRKN